MKTLLLDAATTTLFVGAFEEGVWLKLLKKQDGAMEGLFELAKELFSSHPLEGFERIVLCEGPGRLMSLRIAAVAGNQWAGENTRTRAVYNSLRLAQEVSPVPVAFELRAGAFAILGENNIVEVVGTLPANTVLIGSSVSPDRENALLYARAIDELPRLADKILKSADFFNPPLWAPIDYAKAENKALSKESVSNKTSHADKGHHG